jgi:hypothetical protein
MSTVKYSVNRSFTLFSIIDQTELAINDLVKYIERGSSHEAELPAKYLARSQTNIQFNLVSHNNNEENKTIKKQPKIESSSNILRFVSIINLFLLF